MSEPKKVGIWIRVSTDMQVQGESPEHHERQARQYAANRGWSVIEAYRLDAVSGKSVMAHPETRRMLADIGSGHITGLVFSKLARLARNTRELLEFAEVFQRHNADLASIGESIDTSTPSGRLFFTMIGATGQFEREELIHRINTSIATRAKLGKPIGGQTPYGYRWINKELVIDEDEAPVLRLIFELFLRHQRKKAVARILKEQGYITRSGADFQSMTILRLLRNTTAKGERVTYHTRREPGMNWRVLKPQEEWIVHPCPAIVTEELWDQCNRILDEQERSVKRPGRKAVYLLSGYVKCSCGRSMYVFHDTTRVYQCKPCGMRIAVEDVDEIFLSHLRTYLGSINVDGYKEHSDTQLKEHGDLLGRSVRERDKVAKRINTLITLCTDQALSRERFAQQYKPLEARIVQLDQTIPELRAAAEGYAKMRQSSAHAVQEARSLYEHWTDMEFQQRRAVVEIITRSVEVHKEDIIITLAYAPSDFRNPGNRDHHHTL
ncbi:MAG: recombinase family protein [Mucilaginibacter sp.]